jgi:hypothetical protein
MNGLIVSKNAWFGQIFNGVTNSKNKRKLSGDKDDVNVKGSETYGSSDKGDKEESDSDKRKKKLLILQLDLSVRHLMWVLMDLLSLLNVRFSLMSLTLEIFMKNIN